MKIEFILYSSLHCSHCDRFIKALNNGILDKLKEKYNNLTFKEHIYEKEMDKKVFENVRYYPYIEFIINGTKYVYSGKRDLDDFIKFIEANRIKTGGYYNKYIKMKRKYLKLKSKIYKNNMLLK